MQKIALSFIFLAFVSASANDVKSSPDPLKKLEKIQEYVGSMSTAVSDPGCANCSKEQLFNQCVEDVCSRGQIQAGADDLREQALKDLTDKLNDPKTKVIYENLKKSVKEMILASISKSSAQLKGTREFINNNDHSKDKDQIQLATIFELLDLRIQNDIKTLPPYLQLQVVNLDPGFQKIIYENYDFNSETPDIHYKEQYPGTDKKIAIKQDVKKFEEIMKAVLVSELVKFDPTIKNKIEAFYKSKFYKDLKSNKEVSSAEISDMLKTMSLYKLRLAALKNPYVNSIKEKLDTSKIIEIMQSEDTKSKLNALDAQLTQLSGESEELKSTVNFCANNLLATYLNLPPKGINKSLAKIGEELKNKMDKTVLSKLSRESQNLLRSSLKHWKFETLSNQDYLADLTSSLLKSRNKNKSEEKSMNASNIGLSVLNYSAENMANNMFLLRNIYPDFNTICNVNLPDPAGDKTHLLSGEIQMSWGGLKDINAGKTVLSHELGHLLSFEIKMTKLSVKTKKLYENAMNCLDKKHKGISPEIAEEDFADFVSATMEGSHGNNLSCFLKQKFSDDPIKDNAEIDHSQNFYRLLNVENIMRRNIPETCQKFMELAPTKIDFNSCWNEASK